MHKINFKAPEAGLIRGEMLGSKLIQILKITELYIIYYRSTKNNYNIHRYDSKVKIFSLFFF